MDLLAGDGDLRGKRSLPARTGRPPVAQAPHVRGERGYLVRLQLRPPLAGIGLR